MSLFACSVVVGDVNPSCTLTTIVGTTYSSGTADGIGSVARLNFPVAMAMDPSGATFVVADTNNQVRGKCARGVAARAIPVTAHAPCSGFVASSWLLRS